MTKEIEIDADLTGENRKPMYTIKTPEGLVCISTFMGTHVLVYDDPEYNPVGSIMLRAKD